MLLRALALSLVLITPAYAAFENPPEKQKEEWLYLICKPPLDRKDSNPVINIDVTAHFEPDNLNRITSMDVIHHHFNGNDTDRSHQYRQTFLGNDPEGKYFWEGINKKHSSLIMTGMLRTDRSNLWHYTEEIYRNGVKTNHIDTICTENEGE